MAFKVLVADDSVTIHRLVSLALKEEDIEIYTVSNGSDAIEKIKEIKPDVVLADIFMPRKTGYEVCSFVKGDPSISYIPVILMVGTFEPFDENEAESSGYDGVLVKPFETEQLLKVVKSSIQKSITNRTDVDSEESKDSSETVLDKTIMVDSFDEEEKEREGIPIPELETNVRTVKAKVEAPEVKSMESVVQGYGTVEKKLSETTGDLDVLDISNIKIDNESVDMDEDILGVYERVGFGNEEILGEEELFEDVVEVPEHQESEDIIVEEAVNTEDEEEIILEEESVREETEEHEEGLIENKEEVFEPALDEVKIEEVPQREVKNDPYTINDELIEKIANRVIEKLSTDVIEKIAWEIVPELAELIIKRKLDEK